MAYRLPKWLATELATCIEEACYFTEQNARALGSPEEAVKRLTADWRMVLAEAAEYGVRPPTTHQPAGGK